jgi:hypothetical protein
MNIPKKIQKLSSSQKKILISLVIFITAIPFLFLVFKDFQRNLRDIDKKELKEGLNTQELKKEFNAKTS